MEGNRGEALAVGFSRRALIGGLGVGVLLAVGGPVGAAGSAAAQAATAVSLDAEVIAALTQAINDEYRARATYKAVIARFGSIRPFSNIVTAEGSHISALATLFTRYSLAVPSDPYSVKAVEVPSTRTECCKVGVAAEIANAAMYDRFLLVEGVRARPDIVSVFTNLRDASEDNHLPAFQRCAG